MIEHSQVVIRGGRVDHNIVWSLCRASRGQDRAFASSNLAKKAAELAMMLVDDHQHGQNEHGKLTFSTIAFVPILSIQLLV
jgi:hypothetical protein